MSAGAKAVDLLLYGHRTPIDADVIVFCDGEDGEIHVRMEERGLCIRSINRMLTIKPEASNTIFVKADR